METTLESQIRELDEYKKILYFISNMDISPSMYLAKHDDNLSFFESIFEEVKRIVDNQDKKFIDNLFIRMCRENSAIPFIAERDFLLKEGKTTVLIRNPILSELVVWDSFVFSRLLVVYCLDIDRNEKVNNWDLSSIVKEERLVINPNDYKLDKLDDYTFFEDGIIYREKAYIFNRLLNKDKINASDRYPGFAKILLQVKNNGSLYYRLDDRLSMPADRKMEWTGAKFAEYYGPRFAFEQLSKYNYGSDGKERIVKLDPKTQDRLLMVLKRKLDSERNEVFYDIMIETIPNPTFMEGPIITTFLHGKFYEKDNVFRHIDLANNQYSIDDYNEKFYTNKIDKYTKGKELHYKQWCLDEGEYSRKIWMQLVEMSLEERYRVLFEEFFNV